MKLSKLLKEIEGLISLDPRLADAEVFVSGDEEGNYFNSLGDELVFGPLTYDEHFNFVDEDNGNEGEVSEGIILWAGWPTVS